MIYLKNVEAHLYPPRWGGAAARGRFLEAGGFDLGQFSERPAAFRPVLEAAPAPPGGVAGIRAPGGRSRLLRSPTGCGGALALVSPFRPRVGYLDIETTGSYWPGLSVTVVGLYDGSGLRQSSRAGICSSSRSPWRTSTCWSPSTAPNSTCRC